MVSPVIQTAPTLPAQQTLIALDTVSKVFGDNYAVRDVSLTIKQGEIFGIVGPSGCGKTSTIRMITGVYVPTSGTITVMDRSPQAFRARDRENIGYMPQLFVLYPQLTVLENLRFMASIYGLRWGPQRRKQLAKALDFVELTDARHTLAQNISGGMQRRLQLAAALIHDPSLIIADEPTAGIDPVLRGRFWDQFKQLKNGGRTLVVTTQYVGEVAYCDRVAVMRDGELLTVDTPDGLRRQAIGGEVISFRVDAEDTWNAMQVLRAHPLVHDVRRMRNAPAGNLEVYVSDAGESMPELIHQLGQDPTIDLRHAEEYNPPFDDVFITLMKRADADDARAKAAETEGAAQ